MSLWCEMGKDIHSSNVPMLASAQEEDSRLGSGRVLFADGVPLYLFHHLKG